MNAMEVMREILKREGITPTEASRRMGRSTSYVGTMLNPHKQSNVSASRIVEFCEAMEYEVILRNRDDGFEFLINE